jgi:uncharacterized membrane protein YgcG
LLPISERTCVTVMVGPVRTGFTRFTRLVEVLPDAAFSAAARLHCPAGARARSAYFYPGRAGFKGGGSGPGGGGGGGGGSAGGGARRKKGGK